MGTKLCLTQDEPHLRTFWCPGCDMAHQVAISNNDGQYKGPVWGYNQSMDQPTFTPSVLVKWRDPTEKICHSFVINGKIQFLDDCWHTLKNQTVEVPDWPDWGGMKNA